MAKLVVDTLAVLSDNYIHLLHEPDTGATAVVDPAVAAPVLERLEARGWRLSHILITHHHGDHTGGVPELARRTQCAVVGAGRDADRLPPLSVEVAEGDTFLLGAAAAMVLAVPGHTSGHLAFWFPDSHALFCGDTLFSLGCGRLFEGTAAELWDSLRKLRDLPAETQVYCGHEYTATNGRFARLIERDNPTLLARIAEVEALRGRGRPTIPSRMAEERAANPFLRADEPTVARGVGMAPGTDPVRVLAELRRRKDAF